MNGSRIAKIIKDIDRFRKDLGELKITSVRGLPTGPCGESVCGYGKKGD